MWVQKGINKNQWHTQFIKSCNLNLTKKEINMLFMSVDVDDSGSIDMDEFYPLFHQVCVRSVKDILCLC